MESTSQTLIMQGMNFRVWEGKTESGVRFICLMNRSETVVADEMAAFRQEIVKASKSPDETTAGVLERMGIAPGVGA